MTTDEFPHNTDRGYQRHRREGTHKEADECGCKAAHSEYSARMRLLQRRRNGIFPPTKEQLVARFPKPVEEVEPEIIGWKRLGNRLVAVYEGDYDFSV